MCVPLQLASLPTLPSNRGNTVSVENVSWMTFPCQEHIGGRFRFVPRPLQIWFFLVLSMAFGTFALPSCLGGGFPALDLRCLSYP